MTSVTAFLSVRRPTSLVARQNGRPMPEVRFVIGCEDLLRSDLDCVGWVVNLYFNSSPGIFSQTHELLR